MGPLTALAPPPRRVRLAGREFLVSEARLAPELVALQAWLDGRAGDPHGDYLAGRLTAGEAYTRAEAGAGTPCDDRGREALATAEGVCQTIAAALGRHHPGLTPADVVGLAGALEPGEYAGLCRAFFGSDPVGALARALGCTAAGQGRPLTWAEAVFRLCERYGWTVAEAMNLPVSVVGLALRGGEPVTWRLPARPGESMAEQVERMKALRGETTACPR